MDKLTEQEITKVFALYYGCEIIVEKSCYYLVHEKLITHGTIKFLTAGMLDLVVKTMGDADIKLLLTPLSEITDDDAVEVAKAFYPLSFKGNCTNKWNVERNELYPKQILTVSHKNNVNSFEFDLVDGNINQYSDGEINPVGCNVAAIDKLRELGYALPYKGIDLFKAGIATTKQ